MSITETKAKRQNRTVVLHLGNTLAEYESVLWRRTVSRP